MSNGLTPCSAFYRSWEGQVVRLMFRIKTVDPERMYRGNPPP